MLCILIMYIVCVMCMSCIYSIRCVYVLYIPGAWRERDQGVQKFNCAIDTDILLSSKFDNTIINNTNVTNRTGRMTRT